MNITFINRSPGTGHSIEMLFGAVRDQLNSGSRFRSSWLVLPSISRGLSTVWQNVRFVRQAGLSLVHVTGDVHYAVLGGSGRQTVLTIHDCVILEKNRQQPLRFWLFKWLWYILPMRKAAIVTTISEKTRQELYRYVGRLADKVIVVPNAYNPAFTYSPKRFNADKPTLLHIGTAPHKNLSRLIEAIEGLSCRLLIVGKLTEAEQANLAHRQIDYEQYVNIRQEEIIRLYQQCDIVTFVSLYEGFGMPVLEGQATGRPVLTSALSPMTDVGGPGGCYVDPTDVAAIRAGLLRIWQDEAYRAELVRCGLENVRQYSIERITARYVALYESVAARANMAPEAGLTHPMAYENA